MLTGNPVSLRTLILLRWVAVLGQLAALLSAAFMFQIDLPYGPSVVLVGLSVIVNLATMQVYARGFRPPEGVILGYLAFDLVQLVGLLALTGGLGNPFALLVVAPVTIAATALSDRAVTALGALTIVLVSALAFVSLPLRLADGQDLVLPPLLAFGFWLAIVIGVVFLALYTRRVSLEIRQMSDALLATQMALAREQKLTDLGGVIAATAHELGTPLATIKLTSSELIDELENHPELAHLREDAALIRDQANRCRDILQSMGRAGKNDLFMRQTLLDALLQEAAEPHSGRGKLLKYTLRPRGAIDLATPTVLRRPEIVHGLRNLIQNAVDFAKTTVWIDASWDNSTVYLRISDDGPGYPAPLLARIGEPFLSSGSETRRQYKGMGLGLFIAKTLLERSGARLTFANGTDPFLKSSELSQKSGAIVEVVWPASLICTDGTQILGDNPRNEA